MAAHSYSHGGMDAGMAFDKVFDILRQEMQEGFKGIHSRLDSLNGQTRKHGESIAVLEQVVKHIDTKGTEGLQQLANEFTIHRSRCPFDKDSPMADTMVLPIPRKVLAGVIAGTTVVLAALFKIFEWVGNYQLIPKQ
jgi:hypothetical protein